MTSVKRKPTRRDLLIVIGRLQVLVGEAMMAHNDRNPERQGETDAVLRKAHALCIEVRSKEPPVNATGPWAES